MFASKAPFERMVREILESKIEGARVSKDAVELIQEAAEARTLKLMKHAKEIAARDRRSKVLKADFQAAALQDKTTRTIV